MQVNVLTHRSGTAKIYCLRMKASIQVATQVITKISDMQQKAKALLHAGKVVAFVPTMGYLHEGHLALMREARKRAEVLIVSIFVNPTQFSQGEDFQAYPRDLDRDIGLARREGVDVVFAPGADEVYEEGHQTYVEVERLSAYLCGRSRPGHFKGVATIVTKLFNIVRPHVAVFGEKDYQQLVIIRRLVRDLNIDVSIVGVPTVREPDGLAMSSRNTYLSATERRSALSLFQALQAARKGVAEGVRDAGQIIRNASDLIGSFSGTRIDYIRVCDPDTLDDLARVDGPALMALAVWVGETRLIDNAMLNMDTS